MEKYINHFWSWYEDNLHLNIGIAAGIFVWQLVHLWWLTFDVIAKRLFFDTFLILDLTRIWEYLIVVVDYTEIPAIFTVSILYINELRKKTNIHKNILFLIILNSQWLHLFWITDEFIVAHFRGEHIGFSVWFFCWIAILIDYLELPVIYDTIKKFLWTRR